MNYGFVVDNRRCIGCHACSVACKAEHDVPLGNFRTWVKHVERGEFPDSRRSFTVLRCNHCGDAPCTNICPTRALFHRDDGIVDYNRSHCIACKSCMAACPYDALYLNRHTDVAEKCNYCAHRIEKNLEPACVTACPVHAIISGDLDDPVSEIGRLVAAHETQVRRPELNTDPKVRYIAADPDLLLSWTPRAAKMYLCSERAPEPDRDGESGESLVVYDIPHSRPWGRLVTWYLWTKSLATGPILIAALLLLLGGVRAPELFGFFVPMFSLIMGFVATLFLIGDLERPERFLKTLYHPNFRSWVAWRSYLLILYIGYVFLWATAGMYNRNASFRPLLLWSGIVLAGLVAGYSGFLFRQARGRDLWKSWLAFPHMIVQACLAGSAALALATVFRGSGRPMTDLFLRLMLGCICIHGAIMLTKISWPRGTRERKAAVRTMIQGPLTVLFWAGAVFAGIAIPIYQLAYYFYALPSGSAAPIVSSAAALLGLLAWGDCYIRAGQALPLS
jgi:Fe-S-cluster-containing dehydrogenase component/formate-dependent nitrite reductase membrane component NrfD